MTSTGERTRHTSGRTLVLVGALLAVAVMLALPMRTWLGQRGDLAELDGEIAEARQRVAGLEAQRESWQDPVFVATQARSRLNMVRPGEMGLIVLDRQDESEVPRAHAAAPPTWYGRLWETAADAGR